MNRDQLELLDMQSYSEFYLHSQQSNQVFHAVSRSTGHLHATVQNYVETANKFSSFNQDQQNIIQNQEQDQSHRSDIPSQLKDQEYQLQFDPFQWIKNPIIQGFMTPIPKTDEEPLNTQPVRIPARGITTVEVTVPFRPVRNRRSGTYQRTSDSIFNNRRRNVRKILRQFTIQFQIKKEFQTKWLKILNNPVCDNLTRLQIQLGKLADIYYQTQKTCCENKCQNLFDHLNNMIRSNQMLHAMKLDFEKDVEGQWDCGYTFIFCHYGGENQNQINNRRKRKTLDGQKKRQIKCFIRNILSSN